MKVFKFGGASVKSANAVKNVAEVISKFPNDRLFIVVSAMGKTTNALEWLVNCWYHEQDRIGEVLQESIDYHEAILSELFQNTEHPIYAEVERLFSEIKDKVHSDHHDYYDSDYDSIVSYGEILSTKIISAYLSSQGRETKWVDARQLIKTDHTYREGRVDWEDTSSEFQKFMTDHADESTFITQGFIGSTKEGLTTTLGREGSDYSAAIIAYCLGADSVTIWKDVPGVLNADPKWFDNTVKLDKISYHEAIELSYYGATIIHPKTIKPLENKKIPLYARSFVKPEENGTVIQESREFDDLVPSFIFKVDQILISISPKDFSFIIEENLEQIFSLFAKHRVRIHLMQISALNFSVCVDMDTMKIPALVDDLKQTYSIRYNEHVELVTIRHYDDATIDRVTQSKKILVDQRTRHTARMVMKD